MPNPSMITKVPSMAARISGVRSTSRIRNRSGSLMAAQSTDGGSGTDGASANPRAVGPDRGGLRRTRRCSFMTAMPHTARGAVAATNLVTPSADHAPVRGDGPWPEESSEQAVAWDQGVITYVGPADGLTGIEPEWFEGCTIAPGFVD